LLAFIYKQKDLESVTAKIILYYRKYGFDVQIIRTDAGSKECSEAYSNLLAFYRCRIEPAPAEEQYKNPVERFVQYVKNGASVVLASQSNLGAEFWIFAVLCNVFAWNASVNTLSGDFSPVYHITGLHPDVAVMFRFPFGQKVSVARSKQRASDLSLKNEIGYIIGHSDYSNNGSIVYIPSRIGAKKFFIRSQISPIKEHPMQSQFENLTLEDPIVEVEEQCSTTVSDIVTSMPLELQQANMDMLDEEESKLPRRSLRVANRNNIVNSQSSFAVLNGIIEVQNENPTPSQAMKSKEVVEWIISIIDELKNLIEHSTFRRIRKSDILPGYKAIPTKLVLRIKRFVQKKKSRLVLLGNKDYSDIGNVYAPTANQPSVLLLLALAVYYRLKIKGYDVYGAFLVPEQKRRVYIKLPPIVLFDGFMKYLSNEQKILLQETIHDYYKLMEDTPNSFPFSEDEGYCELLKTMYGQSDSPKEFYQHMNNLLTSNGYTKSTHDPCVFFRRPDDSSFIMISVHVDDFLVAASHQSLIQHIEDTLRKAYEITISESVENYIGMRIDHNEDGSVMLSNPGLIGELVEKLQLPDQVVQTPMRADFSDSFQDDASLLSSDQILRFQEVLGSLIFIVKTRPDIAYATNRLATRQQCATTKDMAAIYRVVMYPKTLLN